MTVGSNVVQTSRVCPRLTFSGSVVPHEPEAASCPGIRRQRLISPRLWMPDHAQPFNSDLAFLTVVPIYCLDRCPARWSHLTYPSSSVNYLAYDLIASGFRANIIEPDIVFGYVVRGQRSTLLD